MLKKLREALKSDPDQDHEKSRRPGLGVYHCHKLQKLRAVPIFQPMMILVVTGHKEVTMDERTYTIRSGERFKRRFGLSPSELRRTRMPDGGETLTVSGE